MKILVATGSFKDVYTSIESCELIKNMIDGGHEVITAPLCDGGEYTLDVLKYYFGNDSNYNEIEVNDVLNPYGKHVSAKYITIKNEAYVISSEIIHLEPDEDEYKNPIRLTDYGLGQLILDAINNGFDRINLCLGGTSTVGYGIGTTQALGTKLINVDKQEMTDIVFPERYIDIASIVFDLDRYKNIKLRVLNDGITKSKDLNTVNPLKIGKSFLNEKERILRTLEHNAKHIYELTGLGEDDAFSGNGGAIYYGIEKLFSAEYLRGAKYFCELFRIEDKIDWADIVITGEGRYDNPHLKKLPITIADIAKKHGKRVIFACGSKDIFSEKTDSIDEIVSCDQYYKEHDIQSEYSNEIDMYRALTPIILKSEIERVIND